MRFTAFVNREAAATLGSLAEEPIATVTVPVRARQRAQWVLGEQALLPRLAARAGVDLLHSLGSTAPVRGRFRRVVTIHDLIYARFPEAHSGLRERGMRVLVPAAARHSDRVIVDSRSTRDDVIDLIGIPTKRIDVVPLGVGVPARDLALEERELRERFALGERRVLLSLSARRPHKNLSALIDALATIPAELRPQLVLPGYPTAHESELRERASNRGVGGDVRFLDWVSRAELEGLWQIAEAFIFPSLYEGFGLPVLEAMSRGVPVACSNSPALAEVAGDAALLFDPNDRGAIAQAVLRVLEDPALREQLRRRGLERVREFTWRASARLTLDSYARAIAGS
jgi:glycosyltransferase involved in cell wall biosynthesis